VLRECDRKKTGKN